ncbi:glycosyltransferase family 4 protein [Dysgonomonas sp. Marseille-P4677]|uniref:glycosyltransferase family 4 protein n=1 Tax=Dysgonomonas sp. Marseille-P4677 TaxID=2364790 RepID=UPI001914BF2F|nr:glycosyltransferase family 4 protein [Dysgonomonas sp. Marseille-P4677]MBK5721493.1 glycosyltransferase family 4 protein [Dysgonomonas sp. Marseille-P4677]
MKKIMRVAAAPISLDILLRGQLRFLNNYYEVVGVASPDKDMHKKISDREQIRTIELRIERRISPFRDLIALINLYMLFRKEKPYIVHSLTPKAGLLSMVAARFARVPVRIHTFTGLIFPWEKGYMSKLLETMDRLTCIAATYVIPEGEGIRKKLINNCKAYKLSNVLANGNINGVDLEYFKPAFKESDNTVTRFVFVGRIVRDKGIEELKEAFQRLDNAELILVGPFEQELNPLSDSCMEWIRQGNGVISVGFKDDIRPYLADADVFVFPSHREGFPNTPIQAGAMGLPSIATNICGCNEIIINGVTGLLIEPHNIDQLYEAMKLLAEDATLRKKMGMNARVHIAEKFSQQNVWNALLQFYQNVS